MDAAAIGMLVLVMVLVGTALVGFWIAALIDVIRAQDMDETARLILALLLIFLAPIGMAVWLLCVRHSGGLDW